MGHVAATNTTANVQTRWVTNLERSFYFCSTVEFWLQCQHANQNRNRFAKEVAAYTVGDDILLRGWRDLAERDKKRKKLFYLCLSGVLKACMAAQ